MNPELETKLNNLPTNPGVYQFFNDKNKVIYVGKAKNLRNRVRSYFHSNISSAKTRALVEKINNLELILTDTEVEALVLENNLIKELTPRYNILLKDDKTFPYIVVTNEPFPRIFPTRTVVRDGSKYFGPYTDVKSMRHSLKTINDIFKIRNCKFQIDQEVIDKKKVKLCLEYHIKKCDGPCEGLITQMAYREMVDQAIKVLSGKTDSLIKELTEKMNKASELFQFEKAAEIRDKIDHLRIYSSKQKIVTGDFIDRDIISVAYEGKDATCSIFNIRSGKLVGKKQLKLTFESDEKLPEMYSATIRFYYNDLVEIPDEIVLETEPDDIEILNEWLNSNSQSKIKFFVPKRSGELKSLLNMCKQNAILQLKEIQLQKMKKDGNVPYVLSALKRDLRLHDIPRRIECFDISNLQGTDTVASMVVFEDGKPKKSQYRKFIIKNVDGPNDFESMREVITRRYSRLKEENETMPDLIMVDGGKGQLSSAVEIIDSLGFKNYNIIGLAKRLEEIFFPGISEAQTIPKTSSSLKLLQHVRDEAHRFAITFHRLRRDKRTFTTELLEIEGIGPNTAQKLLKELGSLEKIKASGKEELAKVVGQKKADLIIEYFAGKSGQS
ncbi:MAG: excinuclease ABC subunit UvrC [Bacteroidota bacterium]|nr:excinuclease ABC subunit UvrC [Bacteroidota bacterium]MDP4197255.1 excinuclease ABC subunit UvrC [Bacteroidota bacterium]